MMEILGMNVGLFKALGALLLLITLDVILGVTIAIKQGKFQAGELARFLKTEVAGYYVALAAVALVAYLVDDPAVTAVVWAFVAAYTGHLIKEFWKKIKVITGIEVPEDPVPAVVNNYNIYGGEDITGALQQAQKIPPGL